MDNGGALSICDICGATLLDEWERANGMHIECAEMIAWQMEYGEAHESLLRLNADNSTTAELDQLFPR